MCLYGFFFLIFLLFSLEFDKQQLSFVQEKVDQAQRSLAEETESIRLLEESMGAVKAKIEKLDAALGEASAQQKEMWKEVDKRESQVQAIRRQLSKSSNQYDQLSKGLASRQALYERMVQERWAIFRKCRMENIDLPVYKNNSKDEDDMDVDTDLNKSILLEEENDAELLVDYRLLDSESRKNDTETMGK